MIASSRANSVALGVGVLDDRFDDVVGVGERVERRSPVASRPSAASRSAGGQLALLDELAEALLDRAARAIERRLRDVDEPHLEPGLREHLGDAVAHRPRADDADRLDRRRHPRHVGSKHSSREQAICVDLVIRAS